MDQSLENKIKFKDRLIDFYNKYSLKSTYLLLIFTLFWFIDYTKLIMIEKII